MEASRKVCALLQLQKHQSTCKFSLSIIIVLGCQIVAGMLSQAQTTLLDGSAAPAVIDCRAAKHRLPAADRRQSLLLQHKFEIASDTTSFMQILKSTAFPTVFFT